MEVSDIIDAVDMEEYISQFCDLEERGGELWGLSPFKDENTPSFSVNLEKKFWYDFSAGCGGNLLDFVMRYHDVNLIKAIDILKKYANITDDGKTVGKMQAARIAKKFRSTARPNRVSRASILDPNYMERFELRKEKLKLWLDEGISWDAMMRFGVRYDAFDNRIVYPVKTYDGDIISVCGRTCDPDYKAKRMRKYTYFQSLGTIDTLFGFSDNKEDIMTKKEIILFEGAKSVMMAYGWGIKNTAAILTSHLSPNQFNFLVKLGNLKGVRIVFALDAEVDITKDENIMRLASYARVEWIKNFDNLLEDKDSPVDKGQEVFNTLYSRRQKLK
ncbi:MAG: hypothetical protein IJ418_16440 [Clostridia bacterium]|nr:hypothetical protein [Clostridia bacterium]